MSRLSKERVEELAHVKIEDAKSIVDRRGLNWAVVIGQDADGYHRATFGVSPVDKDVAAAYSDYVFREMPTDPNTITDRRAENAYAMGKQEAAWVTCERCRGEPNEVMRLETGDTTGDCDDMVLKPCPDCDGTGKVSSEFVEGMSLAEALGRSVDGNLMPAVVRYREAERREAREDTP